MEYLIIYAIAGIVWGIIWGVVVNKVISNKGYYENWFWWGFFFGWIALIVALTKPDNNYKRSNSANSQPSALSNYADEKRDKDVIKNGGWKCSCGRVNPGYITTCVCGETPQSIKRKQSEKIEENKKEEQRKKESDNLDMLKKYKDLLDSGVITQEEFDAKKKELLNL